MVMNEYIKLIIDNLDVSYICSVMLLGYMITKSELINKNKATKKMDNINNRCNSSCLFITFL